MKQHHTETAVLTGDLVASSQLTETQLAVAFATLDITAERIESWEGITAPLQFTRHRGDGWQVVITPARYAPRAAVMMRAALKAMGPGFDTYIGIGTGTLASAPAADLNAATDQVFTRSGAALDAIKTGGAPTLMAAGGDAPLSALVTLLDALAGQWTAAQSTALAEALRPDRPLSFTDIAKHFGKSRQAMTKALRAAKAEHIRHALNSWESDDV